MAKRRVTLTEVSRVAGVSKTAASLALNGHPGTRVSPETAARVRATARELGYRPNLTARALTTQKSQVLGFVSEYAVTQRFASGLIRGAIREAAKHDHLLLIVETEGAAESAPEAFEALLDRGVDGVIYALTQLRDITLPAAASAERVVLLNARAGQDHPSILPDEFEGARGMVSRALTSTTANDVVIVGRGIGTPLDDIDTIAIVRRMDGIRQALKHHDGRRVEGLHLHEWTKEAARDALDEYLSRCDTPPRLVVALNDRIASGVYLALAQHDLGIPDDVAVVSFDDDDIATFLEPELTTAALPYEAMGEEAVRALLCPDYAPGEHLIEMPVRWRASV